MGQRENEQAEQFILERYKEFLDQYRKEPPGLETISNITGITDFNTPSGIQYLFFRGGLEKGLEAAEKAVHGKGFNHERVKDNRQQ